jgi:hypothetical protein
MRYGTARVARVVLALAVACAAFGAMSSSAFAGGSGKQYSYVVNVSPGTAQAGSSTTFDFALKNTSSPGTNLGSAAFTPPLGFSVNHASLPAGAKGHVYVLFNIVLLDNVNVTPGSTLHVSVTVRTPSRCANNHFDHWLPVASASGLFGPLLRLDVADSSLTTDVTCASPATALKFDTQPSNTEVGQSTNPGVTVDIVDAGGNVVDSSSPVTLALGDDPGLGNLGGTLTENASHGVATFNDLSIDQPGVGYTLTASSGSLTGDTSDPFNESQTTTTTCTTNPCTTDIGTAQSDLQISADPAAGSITESVDLGTPLSCADRLHGGYTGFDTNWYDFNETGTVDKTASYEIFGLNSDQIEEVQICFGAVYDFQTSEGGQAQPGTLPDGTAGFIGLLPSCDSTDGAKPCVESVVPSDDDRSGAIATVDIPGLGPTGAPGDPSMHG